MRELSQQAQDQKDKLYNRPIELYRVFLDQETLYFADYSQDIDFFDEQGNPVTYISFPIKRESINTEVDNKVDSVSVSIANANKEISSYIAHTEFQGRKMQIIKVFLDANGTVINAGIASRGGFEQLVESIEMAGLNDPANENIIFEGYMDAPSVNQDAMSVNVVSTLDTLDKELPARNYTIHCGWKFGDASTCGISVPSKTGTIDSISSDYMTINISAITEANNYWKYGNVTIGNENRRISESGTGYLKVEYPFSNSVTDGDGYTLKAGCDKSFDSGHGCTFWSNTDYYGGFLSIPALKDIRTV